MDLQRHLSDGCLPGTLARRRRSWKRQFLRPPQALCKQTAGMMPSDSTARLWTALKMKWTAGTDWRKGDTRHKALLSRLTPHAYVSGHSQ